MLKLFWARSSRRKDGGKVLCCFILFVLHTRTHTCRNDLKKTIDYCNTVNMHILKILDVLGELASGSVVCVGGYILFLLKAFSVNDSSSNVCLNVRMYLEEPQCQERRPAPYSGRCSYITGLDDCIHIGYLSRCPLPN